MEIKQITYQDTKRWILEKHYAGRMPSISYAYGLYIEDRLEGVVTYGSPPSPTLCSSICGKEHKKNVIELNRLVINSTAPKNSASKLVGKSLRMLPRDSIIVSFADSNQNHTGFVYQATNWIYTGKTSKTTQLVDKEGKEFHFRNIGHMQKNNKLNVSLIKRRLNEDKIDRLEIANFLRENKGQFNAKELDVLFGYKDTAAHWFRLDAGFSFPSIDDWKKLKDILKLDSRFDLIMTAYKLVPDRNEIIKKLELSKKIIDGKYRYVYFRDRKMIKKLKYDILPYPKTKSERYECIDIKENKLF